MKHTRLATGLMGLLTTLVAGQNALACHRCNSAVEQLRDQYRYQRRDLTAGYRAEVDAIALARRAAVRQTITDRKVALGLCEPDRSYALQQIKADRKTALASARYGLLAAHRCYRESISQLKSTYEIAIRKARLNERYCRVNGGPAIRGSTTYGWPGATIVEPLPVPAEPEIILGPESELDYDYEIIEEGPVFPDPAPSGQGYYRPSVRPRPAPAAVNVARVDHRQRMSSHDLDLLGSLMSLKVQKR